MAPLKVEHLSAGYGETCILRDISFELKPGELCVVLGQNGAGKSTLLRALLGLLPDSSGEVVYFGRPLAQWPRRELARHVGWVPQSMESTSEFSGLEWVLMGRHPHLGNLGLPSETDVQAAKRALAHLGMSHLEARRGHHMSGGERRLLGLARALVQAPRVLLLDEPTAFLDLKHQVQALRAVREYVQAGNCAIAVLHDINLAAQFADGVLLLRDGGVLANGAKREVLIPSVLESLYELPITQAMADGQTLFAPRGQR